MQRIEIIVLMALTACWGCVPSTVNAPPNGDGTVVETNSISGRVRFFDRNTTGIFFEQEPNDSADAPHFAGRVLGGEQLEIWGETTEPDDLHDRFRFNPTGRVSVTVSLLVKQGDPMMLGVFDGVHSECALDGEAGFAQCTSVETFETTEALEIDGEFDVEVAGQSGLTKYALKVEVEPVDVAKGAVIRPITSSARISQAPIGDGPWMSGEFLAAFQPGVSEGRKQSILNHKNWTILMQAPGGVLRLSCSEPVTQAVAAFQSLPEAAMAQPNYIYRTAQVIPNDELFNLQWHFDLIGLPEAWEVSRGSGNVAVAVIDGGVTAHPDLLSRLDLNEGVDMITDPAVSGDGDGVDTDPTDIGDKTAGQAVSSFHGTHVSGIVAAASNNALGVAGSALEGVRIVPIRALGVGGVGSSFDIAEAIKYAAGLANISGQTIPPVDVVNMSFGATLPVGAPPPPCEQAAIEAAFNAGVVLVAAAGNDNSSNPSFPAAFDQVISVGSIGPDTSRKASYSNFGPTIDVVAPGGEAGFDVTGDGFPDGVLSTLADDSTPNLTFAFGFLQGTSQASPHVAGVAALMLSVNPDLTPTDVRDLLRSTARDLGAPGRDDTFGFGLVQASDAVRAARDAPGGPPPDDAEDAPVLGVTTQTLDFGADLTELTIGVLNGGSGMLSVEGVSVIETIGTGFIEVEPGPPNDSSNVGSVIVRVDRAGQEPGSLRGQVLIDAGDAGRAVVNVIVEAGESAGSDPPPIIVLLVDPSTLAVVATATVDLDNGLSWEIDDVEPGEYLLIAGSDNDGDGVVCGPTDLCGGVPTLGNLSPVTIEEGDSLTDVVITITESILR